MGCTIYRRLSSQMGEYSSCIDKGSPEALFMRELLKNSDLLNIKGTLAKCRHLL